MNGLDEFKRPEVEDHGMAFSDLTIPLMQVVATWDDHLDVPHPAVRTILRADVNTRENGCGQNWRNCIVKNELKGPQCFRIMWRILRPMFSVFDFGAGPNLVHSSSLVVKLPERFRLIRNLLFKSASNRTVIVKRQFVLFVQVENLSDHGSLGSVKPRCDDTNRNSVRQHALEGELRHWTRNSSNPVSSNPRYLRIQNARQVGPPGCISDRWRHWYQHWRPTGQ